MTDAEIRENAAGDFVMPDGSVVDRKNFAPYTNVPRPEVGAPVAAPIPDAAPTDADTDDETMIARLQLAYRKWAFLTPEADAKFTRWLAAHDRAVRDAALTEAADAVERDYFGAASIISALREGTPNE